MTTTMISRGAFCVLAMILAFAAGCSCGDDDDDADTGDLPGVDDDASDDDAADDDTDDDAGDDDASDDDDTGDDDTGDDDTDDDDTSDDDTSDDDTIDDDASDDDTGDDDTSDDDTGDDDTGDDDLIDFPPDDGRLYAAAGRIVVTPNETNHPEPFYMGGTSQDRVATGTHDELYASALALAQGDEHVIIVSLDLVGWPRSPVRRVQDDLDAMGFDGAHVLIQSTHNHEGPDTMGIWGPDYLHTGADATYNKFLHETIVELVLSIWAELVPVTMQAATETFDDPGTNDPFLQRDSRKPVRVIPYYSAARFVDDEDGVVATLVNWHTHPEVVIGSKEFTSDFPGYLRDRIESLDGGTAVYLTGAVGGLSTPLGVKVPALDENGDRIIDGNGQVYLSEGTWEKTRSLGWLLADAALDALDGATPDAAPTLAVSVADTPIPGTNPFLLALFVIGLVDYELQDLLFDAATCGLMPCVREQIGVVRLGDIVLVTSPGETFPETIIGREASSHDYGGTYGVFDYPAMTGVFDGRDIAVPMHMALTGDEIGYMVPKTDFHELDHPDFYEEGYCLGYRAEETYRAAMNDLLDGAL
ncbi:hypothetical protein K8I61_05830 [bacterium]|nr:hypothetical protein [bacterium]